LTRSAGYLELLVKDYDRNGIGLPSVYPLTDKQI
jgi:hypothetical protein